MYAASTKISELLAIILLIFMWSRACTQEELTLSLTGSFGSRNILILVCMPSSIPADTITLTINGESDIRLFGFINSPRIVDNGVEFINPSYTASNNSLVALCHSEMVTSNSYTITKDIDPNYIPIIFNATSLNLVVPDQLNITCTGNSNEVNPDSITLRLNGGETDTTNFTINGGKMFMITSSLLLNNVVAQCTHGILGSKSGIINVRERVCGDCTDEYFCDGTSFCYAPQTLCNSTLVSICEDSCPHQLLDGDTCQMCELQCGTSEYFCVSTSSCLPYTTLCNGIDSCDEGCKTQFSSDENDEFCDSCVKEEECEDTEYFCRTTQTCLPYSTLCNGSVECQLTCFDTAAGLRTDEGEICGADCADNDEINCVFSDGTTPQCVAPSTTSICGSSLFHCENVCRGRGKTSEGVIAGIVVGVILAITFSIILIIVAIIVGWLKFNCQSYKKLKLDDNETAGQYVSTDDNNVTVIQYGDIETAVQNVDNETALQDGDNESVVQYGDNETAVQYAWECQKMPQEPSVEDESCYQTPKEDENGCYAQLRTNTLERSSVTYTSDYGNLLGSGQFGLVYKGVMNHGGRKVEVAVKILKTGSKKEDRVKLLQEAAVMAQFNNSYIVTNFGVVTQGEPILLVLELLTGDLCNHLLNMRSRERDGVSVNDHILLSFCRQVASGMAYLSGKAFVHRDLAARNVLVSRYGKCKIAGFGMSHDMLHHSVHGGIPVKWTAPEAFHYKKYSTTSDMWSYGILMYEIWSLGHKPYGDTADNEVMQLVDLGYRLPPPPGCPRHLYSIMISCWDPETDKRPRFPDLDKQFSQWAERDMSVFPKFKQLRGDLQCGEGLYIDLQWSYISY